MNFIRNADLSLEDFRYAGDDEIKVKSSFGEELTPQENSLKESAPLVEMLYLTSVYNGVSAIPCSSKYRVMSPKEVSGSAYISNISRTWSAAKESATIIFVRIFFTTVGSKSKL